MAADVHDLLSTCFRGEAGCFDTDEKVCFDATSTSARKEKGGRISHAGEVLSIPNVGSARTSAPAFGRGPGEGRAAAPNDDYVEI